MIEYIDQDLIVQHSGATNYVLLDWLHSTGHIPSSKYHESLQRIHQDSYEPAYQLYGKDVTQVDIEKNLLDSGSLHKVLPIAYMAAGRHGDTASTVSGDKIKKASEPITLNEQKGN